MVYDTVLAVFKGLSGFWHGFNGLSGFWHGLAVLNGFWHGFNGLRISDTVLMD